MPRALLLALVLGAGCQPVAPEAREQAILGGTRDTGDPAVVLLVASDAKGTPVYDCTAVIVSPHVAVTAAHCVNPLFTGANATFALFLGDDHLSKMQLGDPKNFVDALETDFDPKFDPNNPLTGHDIGVVITGAALTPKPIPMRRTPITAADMGKPLRLVGYGQTIAGNNSTSGQKFQVSTTLGDFTVEHVIIHDMAHTFCNGDSGGPELSMINGVETISAIISFRRTVQGMPVCTGDAYGCRMDNYAATFVDPYILAADPPPGDAGAHADLALPPHDAGTGDSATKSGDAATGDAAVSDGEMPGGCSIGAVAVGGAREGSRFGLGLLGVAALALALRRRSFRRRSPSPRR